MAFILGEMISGIWGGLLAAMAVLALPFYSAFAHLIMSDVPCAVLFLVSAFVYLRLRQSVPPSNRMWILAGIVAGLAMGVRPATGSVVLPFLVLLVLSRNRTLNWKSAACFLSAPAFVVIATLIYNREAWGSFFRNGYNFWSPVPYDYPWLTFSVAYIGNNLKHLFQPEVIFLGAATVIFSLLQSKFPIRELRTRQAHSWRVRAMLEFLVLATGPMTLLYLLYFGEEARYFLPATVLLAVLCGGLLGRWLAFMGQRLCVVATIIIAVVIVSRDHLTGGPPFRRMVADEIVTNTPENALILSNIDPVTLEYFVVRESHRRIIPMSRKVEYALNTTARTKIEHPDPPPAHWWDHRCIGLLKGGARDLVPFTADERPDWIIEQAKSGVPVFFDMTDLLDQDEVVIQALQRECVFVKNTGPLLRVRPKG